MRSRGRISQARNSTGRTAMRRPTWPIPRARPGARLTPDRSPELPERIHSQREERTMFDTKLTTHRRGFLGSVAATAAALGLGEFLPRRLAAAQPPRPGADAAYAAWLNKIVGKHKMVFDAPEP